MDDLISVIIPCYNAKKTIEKCVYSILQQDYSNFEIIAVNDGSNDTTLNILRKLSEKDGRISVINQTKSGGVSAARNIGLKRARGEYISFVDADDYIEKTFLSKLKTFIKGADFSVCYFSSSLGDIEHSTNVNSIGELFEEMMVPRENIAAFVWNRLYRSEIIRNNGICFDENVYACEDTLFNFKYILHSHTVGICKEHLYHYIINSSSAMFGETFNDRKISANLAYRYMLDHAQNKSQKQWVEIAAMWFNLILKRQIYNSKYSVSPKDMNTINRMLGLNSRAFMRAPIPAKYKVAYPIWKNR